MNIEIIKSAVAFLSHGLLIKRITIYLPSPGGCLIHSPSPRPPSSLPSQLKCHSAFPSILTTPPISSFLSTAVVHALSAAGTLNAHFTRFAQRFAYLQVNCCECSRCSGKSRESEAQERSEGWKMEGEGLFSLLFFFL